MSRHPHIPEGCYTWPAMIIHHESLPDSLPHQGRDLVACLTAFSSVVPVEKIILFGSHARGEASPESDVDLCIVARGIRSQHESACRLRRAVGRLRDKPPLSLIPISPERLAEKQRIGDPFFSTLLAEGICIADED